MRGVFITIIAFSVLLLSCGKQPETVVEPQPLPFSFDGNLMAIDSLMQQRPDSALMILTSFRPERNEMERSGEISSKFNANYQSLLFSEALYKTGNAQLNRFRSVETCHGASLQEAVRCFDSLAAQYPGNDDIVVLSARAHYMNGVGFYENDSVVEACREYLKTLEIMENRFDEDELVGYKAKFMCLTYNRLAELFSDQFMAEQSIFFGKKALHYCKIEPTSKYCAANLLCKIVNTYNILQQYDTACYYYHKAIEFLPDTNNFVYRDLIANMAVSSYFCGHGAEQTLRMLKQITNQTEDKDEISTRYLTIGSIYYKESLFDTAIVYLKQVFDNKTDVVDKYQSASFLVDIYKKQGDTINLSKYEKYLADISSSHYSNMMDVSILDDIIHDYLEKQQEKNIPDKQKSIWIIIIVSAIIIISVIVTAKLKNKKTTEEANKSKQKLDELKRKIEQKRTESESKFAAFLNEPVCRKINDMICDISISSRDSFVDYPQISLDDKTIVTLGETVSIHFPYLKPNLITKYPNIKQEDLLLCYLYLLGLENKQIAVLRNYSYSSIRKQALRLQKSLKTSMKLSDYIRKNAYLV